MLNSNEFDEAHWRNVLSYCKDGNFQALLDEYVHILVDSNGINDAENKHELIHALMLEAVKTHSASYTPHSIPLKTMLSAKEKGIALFTLCRRLTRGGGKQ